MKKIKETFLYTTKGLKIKSYITADSTENLSF